MSDSGKDELRDDWQVVIGRIQFLKKTAGADYGTLTQQLVNAGYSVVSESLSRNLTKSPPRSPDRLINHLAAAFAKLLKARRPDLEMGEFEATLNEYIRGRLEDPLQVPDGKVVRPPIEKTAIETRIDLWTPGLGRDGVASALSGLMENEAIEKLADLSERAIEAIGKGDFAEQLAIAEKTIALGESFPATSAQAEGFYLKGEALRLLGDFEPDRAIAMKRRKEAVVCYEYAADLLSGDPRALRGRARTLEVLGFVDEALEGFDSALVEVERQSARPSELMRFSTSHEAVRSLRHKLTCLAAIHSSDMTRHSPQAQRREHDIRRLLQESSLRHQQTLTDFSKYETWWQIEWFMAEVLHAKAWVVVREMMLAARHLEGALEQRLNMIPNEGVLSSVELGNIQWWCNVAVAARSGFLDQQRKPLDQIVELSNTDCPRQVIKLLGQNFLRAGGRPWSA